jgi:hypothetical protein
LSRIFLSQVSQSDKFRFQSTLKIGKTCSYLMAIYS